MVHLIKMAFLEICNKIIEYSFYALFFLVPLVIAGDTSELFEFNKMWLTFGLALIIAAAWFTKMILQKRIWINRTPLDIPIFLFLLSQFIATIFSWDMYVSIWGYYSRFNGGLLSIITYIFLYYAFVSNFSINAVTVIKKSLFVSLFSGLVVALWGLPSHFGHDPTCFMFRRTFDVSCWTEDFQPRVRIFSTLGQPDWLAAYLAILIPVSITMFISVLNSHASNGKKYNVLSSKYYVSRKNLILATYYILLTTLFYIDLLFTRARSGIIANWFALALFFILYLWTNGKKSLLKYSHVLVVFIVLVSITFFIGTPFSQMSKFTFEGIKAYPPAGGSKSKIESPTNITEGKTQQPQQHTGELGGTDSGEIRSIVWKGAINIWKQYPLFGTGVETFASAYYRYKPAAQNLTSEWNFLYNKAHNEFLNYLATTGLVGLATYLGMTVFFIVLCIKYYVSSIKKGIHTTCYILLNTGLLASYISILITNFFGFSVVITNIYLFMIPAFIFFLQGTLDPGKILVLAGNREKPINTLGNTQKISIMQWTMICAILIITLYLISNLFRFWFADKSYSYGYDLDRTGDYLNAYTYLHKAVEQRGEPVFKDALAANDAALAVALLSQKDSGGNKEELKTKANALAQEAIDTSDQLTSDHENNIVFWKTRTKIFYTLSQIDTRYLPNALQSIEKAAELAPNDASISYNLGVLYGQNNDIKKGIGVLENTIKLKPNYQDAHFALGLFYREDAVDEKGKVVNQDYQQKAVMQMQYIIDHFPNNSNAKDALKSWEKK
ncbi:MAG: O-antigen ligase family protein [Patescibacteria group bacterium]